MKRPGLLVRILIFRCEFIYIFNKYKKINSEGKTEGATSLRSDRMKIFECVRIKSMSRLYGGVSGGGVSCCCLSTLPGARVNMDNYNISSPSPSLIPL